MQIFAIYIFEPTHIKFAFALSAKKPKFCRRYMLPIQFPFIFDIKKEIYHRTPLFRNKKFMLDEIMSQNASKIAKSWEQENPNRFFDLFLVYYVLLTVDVLVYTLC